MFKQSEMYGYGFFFAMLMLALVGYDSTHFFSDTLKWMCLASMASAVLLLAGLRHLKSLFNGSASIEFDTIDLSLIVFLFYAGLSLCWSPDPRGGLISFGNWLVLSVIFVWLKHCSLFKQPIYTISMLTSVVLASAIALGLYFRQPQQWGGFFNENFLTEFLLLTLPFIGGLMTYVNASAWKSRLKGLVLAFLLGWLGALLVHLLLQNPSKIEWFVLPSALALFVCHMLWRNSRLKTVLFILALITAISAVVTVSWHGSNGVRDSLFPRFALCLDSLLLFAQAPILGHGIGGFQSLFPSVQELHSGLFPALNFSIGKFGVARSAHNDYLEFLCDFGLVGLGLFAIPIIALWRRLIRQPKVMGLASINQKMALMVVVMVLANAWIEFPLQNPATALLAAIALAMLAQSTALPLQFCLRHHGLIGFTSLVFVITACVLLFYSWRAHHAQIAFRSMTMYYHSDPQKAFALNAEAVKTNPLDFRMRVQLYESLVHWNRALGTPPLDKSDYDAVYVQALTAGPQYLMSLRRVEYLLDTRRYQERETELVETLKWLRTHFARRADVWIADTYYHLLSGRVQAASMSLAQTNGLQMDAEQQQRIMILNSLLQQPR